VTEDPQFPTDELAEWERQVHSENPNYVTVHLAPKLIAALRASRAEVEELIGKLAEANWPKLRAEVERLRGEVFHLTRDRDNWKANWESLRADNKPPCACHVADER
jgi:hypothetical protein